MARKDRDAWLRAGLRRLARFGVEGVRVEPLAKDLGVTKGSFYWHFRDRDELLTAMLAKWGETATEAVIVQAEEAGAGSYERLERLVAIATKGFDADLEHELRNWARREKAAELVVEEIDRRRVDYVRRRLSELGFDPVQTEVRAFLLYSSLLGNDLLPDSHGRFSRKRVLRESFKLLAGQGGDESE